MSKIYSFFAKRLGIISIKEHERLSASAIVDCQKELLGEILSEMERINGTPGDQWAKHMYLSIKMRYEHINKTKY